MAGRIPQEFFDQLLARVDLVELVNARVPLRRAGHEFVACCPFHAEKTPSFSVSPRKQFYHCFGCGAHGNAIGFLMAYERLEFLDAVEELARPLGLALPQHSGGEKGAPIKPLLHWLAQAERFYRQQLREHPARQRAVDYLRQRGLTGQIAGAFGIGYAPPGWDSLGKALRETGATAEELLAAGLISRDDQNRARDRFRDRIIFPIRDRRGRTIGFGGRALDGDTTPKYLNSPETPVFHKGSELYGFYEARTHNPPPRRLLVVEGYMDVVALAQHEVWYAVATLGTATTAEHIERMFRCVDELVFCFDGDRAGRAAAWRALESALPFLRDGREASFLFLPDGEDPDSLIRAEGRAAFERRLEQAAPLADYLFAECRAQTDMKTLAGCARLAELARPLLQKLPDGNFRDLMDARLCEEAKINSKTQFRPPPVTTTDQNDLKLRSNKRLIQTPLRKAIALLLYRPELAQALPKFDLLCQDDDELGIKLLTDLINLLRVNSHLNTAALLERYRDTPEGAILERLAAWQPEVSEQDYQFEREFCEIIAGLERRGDLRERLPDILLQRGSPRALSPEEREAMRNLGKAQKV
ncbi:MAG: DNA primase [Candidatus Competibacter sp.]|nr:DNA primase [Candidatus Competibacter sp.]